MLVKVLIVKVKGDEASWLGETLQLVAFVYVFTTVALELPGATVTLIVSPVATF